MKKIILTWIFFLVSCFVLAQSGPYRRVCFEADGQQTKELLRAGVMLDHVQRSGNCYTGDFSNEEYTAIKKYSSKHKILIKDVGKYYEKRSNKELKKKQKRNSSAPVNFHLGSMAGFLTLQEIENELDSMQTRFPSLITVKQSIGNSLQNRPVYFIKISDNPSLSENDEAQVLYDALHHAREPVSMMQMIYFMWYLLENYGTDEEVTYLVDHRELFFIPVVNPDGYYYNQTNNPNGGGMWRKNRRNNGDGTFGVDLNRNYAYDWGLDDFGSSPFGEDDNYRGTAAFSEPETQAMKNFINSHQFKTNLSYHSFSNVLLYPWGAKENELTPDSATFNRYSEQMTLINQYQPGTPSQAIGYTGNGGNFDWLYGDVSEHDKIISMSPEVGGFGDGFWPAPNRIIPLCAENVAMNLLNAWFAGSYVQTSVFNLPEYQTKEISIPVKYHAKGLDEELHLQSYIEFISNSNLILSNTDTLKKDSLKTLQVFNYSFNISLAPQTPTNTMFEAILHTTYDSFTQKDTFQFNYNGNTGFNSEYDSFDFTIAPNPADHSVNITFNEEARTNVLIYHQSGILALEEPINNKKSFSTAELTSGIYLIQLKSGKKLSEMKRLVVHH